MAGGDASDETMSRLSNNLINLLLFILMDGVFPHEAESGSRQPPFDSFHCPGTQLCRPRVCRLRVQYSSLFSELIKL